MILESLHPVRRVAPTSGEHLVRISHHNRLWQLAWTDLSYPSRVSSAVFWDKLG
jgi:hypothetical protein